ncbi:hypothetical protein [Mesorhizobium tamadayense]|uniref:calcium-binding protein n=1 Tax=Mesorhizobium tamadayense TaxID=425306 RepID=UPI003CCA6E3A
MLIEFYKVSSFNGTTATPVLVDSYFVPTPAGRTPTIVNGGYVLNGTTGADYLWGLGGNDTLIGGKGNDLARPRQPAKFVRVPQGRQAGHRDKFRSGHRHRRCPQKRPDRVQLVPSRSVMAGGVTAAKRPPFLRESRRAWACAAQSRPSLSVSPGLATATAAPIVQ